MAESFEASSSSHDKNRNLSVSVGTDDYCTIIEEGLHVIDKTLFIKEWMEQGDAVSVILRPRRFGKTTNLTMLKAFLSIGAKAKDFDRFLIGKETDFVRKHVGQYPVVLLQFKGLGGDTWEEMFRDICVCLRDVLVFDWNELSTDDLGLIGLETDSTDESVAAVFLLRLTRCIHKSRKRKVIVLIDEYDAPLNHAYRKQYYNRASSFFGKFFSNGLKSNPALQKACLMGILELRGPGMLSGLNNLAIYSSASDQFSLFFGFTKFEVVKFLSGSMLETSNVMEWYNGYCMGCHQMVNPWSFMRYYISSQFKSYWVHTANTESIQSLLHPSLTIELIEVLADLHYGKMFSIGMLSTVVDYGISSDVNSILCLLVHTGYLTCNGDEVYMPNKEIKYEWQNCGFGVASSGVMNSPFYRDMLRSLSIEPFKIAFLRKVMSDKLRNCSFLDTHDENSYHMYYFGLFIAVFGPLAISNREAGHGRYDIGVEMKDLKRLFIFEIKYSKNSSRLQIDAKRGLQQILNLKYYDNEQYLGWTWYAIGVSFHGKLMSELEFETIRIS